MALTIRVATYWIILAGQLGQRFHFWLHSGTWILGSMKFRSVSERVWKPWKVRVSGKPFDDVERDVYALMWSCMLYFPCMRMSVAIKFTFINIFVICMCYIWLCIYIYNTCILWLFHAIYIYIYFKIINFLFFSAIYQTGYLSDCLSDYLSLSIYLI